MVDLSKAKDNPAELFWHQLDGVAVGMLGIEASSECIQPMAMQPSPATNEVWFFAKKNSELVMSIGEGKRAQLVIVGKDHDFHACVRGTLMQIYDTEVIDKYLSVVTNAWFGGGKSDPELILLRLSMRDATIWASANNPIVFGWEIAKANMSSGKPDLGVRTELRF